MVNENATRYAKIPQGVLAALRTDELALAVYTAIALHADPDGVAWPEQSTIAEILGRNVGTVRVAIGRLKRARLLDVEPRMVRGRKVGNRYRLTPERGEARVPTERGEARATERGEARVPRARDPLPKKREQTHMNKETPTPSSTPVLASVTDLHPGKLLDVPTTVEVVFREWQSAIESWRRSTGRRPSRFVLSEKRKALIRARLGEGFDVDDLKDAVRGWRRSGFHCGANDRRKPYNSLELILRDADHVEQFRDMERDHGASVPRADAAPIADPAIDAVRRMRDMEGRG